MSGLVNNVYWKWERVISPKICRTILEDLDWAVAKDGLVVDAQKELVTDPRTRKADILWGDPLDPFGCIARSYLEVANQNAGWGYILTGQEDTQFCRYKSIDEGFYDWHMDAAPPKNNIQRKLTCVVLLNDSCEFEGGELQLKSREGENMLKNCGDLVVFPSFAEHMVTPVTKGVRYTAVTWAIGPSFR